jgi:outer membrane cobalamin receptor
MPLAVWLSFNPGTVLAQSPDSELIEEVVVTGTRIVRGNPVSASPITTVESSDIEERGIIRIEDMLNVLPLRDNNE